MANGYKCDELNHWLEDEMLGDHTTIPLEPSTVDHVDSLYADANDPLDTDGFQLREERPIEFRPTHIGVGVDVGMTYSGAAFYYELYTDLQRSEHIPLDNAVGEQKFPSLVYVPFGSQEGVVVGRMAGEQRTAGTNGKLFSLFKRDLGTSFRDTDVGMPVTATLLTAQILRKVRLGVSQHLAQQGLGDVEVRYTFTYPGKWQEAKLHALQDAIREAGYGAYTVLEEPVAAAVGVASLGGKFKILQPGQIIFVCDLGGGTLDLSVMSPSYTEAITVKAAPGGDPQLGMSNLDKILALHLMRKQGLLASEEVRVVLEEALVSGEPLERAWRAARAEVNDNAWWSWLLYRCEMTKLQVCNLWNHQESWPAMLPNGARLVVTKDEFAPYIEAMNVAVKRSAVHYLSDLRSTLQIEADQVTCMIVAGGGSRLPGIRESLASLLPNAIPLQIKESEVGSLVQRGAALCAFRPEIVMERRCGSSFGIYTWSPETPKYPRYMERAQRKRHAGRMVTLYPTYRKLLHRHQHIPLVPVKYPLQPYQDGLTSVSIPILQGENEDPDKNRLVGTVRLRLRSDSSHMDTFWVEFSLGEDGLIHVQGRDKYGQVSNDVSFTVERDAGALPEDDTGN